MDTNAIIIDSVLVVLGLSSVYSWAIIAYKFSRLNSLEDQDKIFAEKFWAAPNWQSGVALAQAGKGKYCELAKVGFIEVAEILRKPNSLKFLGAPREILEMQLQRTVQNIAGQLSKGMTALATIGSISTFVGLFGTVWGIMNAMQAIALTGQASIDVVAGPIGEALIATALGILTAMPAVVFYNYFSNRLKLAVISMDSFAESFLRLASAHIATRQE
jgi:biopolymer transport protein ExbB